MTAVMAHNARLLQIIEKGQQKPTTPPSVVADGSPPPKPTPKPTLPEGWKSAVDSATGRVYYYNKSLSKTQFEHPGDSPPMAPPRGEAREPPTPTPMLYNASVTDARLPSMPGPSSSGNVHVLHELLASHEAQVAYAPTDSVRAFHAAEAARIRSRLQRVSGVLH